jgi:hypothetical protein
MEVRMIRLHSALICIALSAASCLGGTLSVTGDFDTLGLSIQWDPYVVEFTTFATSDVLIESFGYGGGTNAQGQVIPAGGFAPIVSLFSGLGPGAVFLGLNDGVGCTGCSDPLLQLPAFPAGAYTLAVTAYANYPWAYWDPAYSTLGDGFLGLGFLEGETTNFAVDITSDALGPVPEPSTALLCGTAFLAVVGMMRRFLSRPGRGR